MNRLLLSLPLSNEAQKYYGFAAPTHNKVGDAGIDLPFIESARPYDTELPSTLMRLDFGTLFAMYTILSQEAFDCFYIQGNLNNIYIKYFLNHRELQPTSFDIRCRSSIDKTPFRLSNCIGTIDETYKGLTTNFVSQVNRKIGYPDILEADTLKASLDYLPWLGEGKKKSIDKGDRLLQIVAPNLDSIVPVRLDYTEENCIFWSEVISNKSRGGFGSTSNGSNG